jgi:hypothetical protein
MTDHNPTTWRDVLAYARTDPARMIRLKILIIMTVVWLITMTGLVAWLLWGLAQWAR